MNKRLDTLTNGIVKSNPTFRLVLGTCPTLAVTTQAMNGLAMGAAVIFVLMCSNMMISLLRKVIPAKVRIPAYVVIIATFVAVVQMVMRKWMYSLYEALGIFLPLIVVNCIILARAEAFASSNTVGDSALDGLGMGVGFTISLTFIGIIRELLGAGSVFGLAVPGLGNLAMTIFILPAGGFLVYGCLMALANYIARRIGEKKLENTKKRTVKSETEEAQTL